MRCHGSCVVRTGHAILLLGPPGSGKSDLALRLIDRGFELVADDRVVLVDGAAAPPPALAGLLEVRGLGLLRLPFRAPAPVALVLELGGPPPRLPPEGGSHPVLPGVPALGFDPLPASAAQRAELALDCALGRRRLACGFVPAADHDSGPHRPGLEAPPGAY